MNGQPAPSPDEEDVRTERKGFPTVLAALAAAFAAAFLALHLAMVVWGGVDNAFSQFVNAARKDVVELVAALFAAGLLPVPLAATALGCGTTRKPRKRILRSALLSFVAESLWALPFAVGASC